MEKQSSLSTLIGTGNYPLEQRIEDKKRGIGRQRYPIVGDYRASCYIYFRLIPYSSVDTHTGDDWCYYI